MKRLSDQFEIYQIDDFLTRKECDHIVELGKKKLQPSTIVLNNKCVTNPYRTSKTSFFDGDLKDEVIKRVSNRMVKTVNYYAKQENRQSLKKSESIQMQYYNIGNFYNEHYDSFEEAHLVNKTQRTYTCMIYLNDVEEGGCTFFPKLDMAVMPQKGRAVIWNNLLDNGKRNELTLHAGEPVIEGEKYIITKWFRTGEP